MCSLLALMADTGANLYLAKHFLKRIAAMDEIRQVIIWPSPKTRLTAAESSCLINISSKKPDIFIVFCKIERWSVSFRFRFHNYIQECCRWLRTMSALSITQDTSCPCGCIEFGSIFCHCGCRNWFCDGFLPVWLSVQSGVYRSLPLGFLGSDLLLNSIVAAGVIFTYF